MKISESLIVHPFYINKIRSKNITYPQAKLILNLNNNHNIKFHHGIDCIKFNSQQIDQMLRLKEIGIPIFWCISYTKTTLYTEEQINLFIELLKMGVNYHYSNKVILNFTNERLDYFCKLINSNMWFAKAYNLTEQKVF